MAAQLGDDALRLTELVSRFALPTNVATIELRLPGSQPVTVEAALAAMRARIGDRVKSGAQDRRRLSRTDGCVSTSTVRLARLSVTDRCTALPLVARGRRCG